jgi:hypothetical protein
MLAKEGHLSYVHDITEFAKAPPGEYIREETPQC